MGVALCFHSSDQKFHSHDLHQSHRNPADAVRPHREFCNDDRLRINAISSAGFLSRTYPVAGTILFVLLTASEARVFNKETSEGRRVPSSRLGHRGICGNGDLSTDEGGWTQALSEVLVLRVQEEPNTKPLGPSPDSRGTKAILAKLDEPIAMDFPGETPLEEVLAYIKKATKKGPDDAGIPIYVDPLGLGDVGSTLTSVVRINWRDAPLRVSLTRILDQLGFSFTVKDDVLIISSPTRIRQEMNEAAVFAKDASPNTSVVMAKLEKPIAMRFDASTPLDDILRYIKKATKGSPNDREIAITVVPSALEAVGMSLNSLVIIDLEGVPLKTSLRLLLKQLGLAYVVKEGRVIINTPEVLRKLQYTGASPDSPVKSIGRRSVPSRRRVSNAPD
jgi:hypothetical protein